MPQPASLPHEATGQHNAVVHVRTAGNNEILAHHALTDVHRGFSVTVDAAIVETAGTGYAAIVSNAHILDTAGIQDGHVTAYRATIRSVLACIKVCQFLQTRRQHGTMTVESHDIGHVGGQFVVDRHLAPTRLVQYGHFYAVAKL